MPELYWRILISAIIFAMYMVHHLRTWSSLTSRARRRALLQLAVLVVLIGTLAPVVPLSVFAGFAFGLALG